MQTLPKFIVRRAGADHDTDDGQGAYLHNFDRAWLDEYGDDPSCWTFDRSRAAHYTCTQIDKMRGAIAMFQGQIVVEKA